ncbi:Rne/Rng family ribonuclease [Nocardioides piscis]|uniref:Ribonuclease E n=1 Tax=Nocardioides piscis TaxID=2714938 RepID=A0A6G7YK12_9ACTN|nr:Rne/Rng family ribonuclease [Nocardioides piscis]QIK77075.1 Rne/Rng family ribonuclease [Nocardioides piscis]
MLDDNPNETQDQGSAAESPAATAPVVKRTTRKTAARKTATAPTTEATAEPAAAAAPTAEPSEAAPAEAPAAPVVKKTTRTRSTAKKAAAEKPASTPDEAVDGEPAPPAKKAAAKRATAKKAAARPSADEASTDKPVAKKTASRRTAKKAATVDVPTDATSATAVEPDGSEAADAPPTGAPVPLFQPPAVTTRRRRPAAKTAAVEPVADETTDESTDENTDETTVETAEETPKPAKKKPAKKSATKKSATATPDAGDPPAQVSDETDESDESDESDEDGDAGEASDGTGPARRRRRRGGRRRRKGGDSQGDGSGETDNESDAEDQTDDAATETDGEQGEAGEGTSRRRRRRRRTGEDGADEGEDDANTVTRVRSRRAAEDQITAIAGSTRLEAKKQRRRDGREAGRRRAPIVSEAEFLARREAVDRVMVIRQRKDLTQIAVLEDKVLVEHYVARESQTSLIGNVYLGRVQNVLPSMEAAFIDIGKGRNAVLYAGEVNWAALGHKDGQARKIESVLSSGQPILVQVTKDPVGHKGARLTSQVSLAGRFLVYVPDGTTSGISRKLPDTERNRLKSLLKEIVPDTAGVIVRTAAEGASEEELTQDVERLKARWEAIEAKTKGGAPQLLYGEPDLTLKVVRDLFTEDFAKLVIEGDDAWSTVQDYVAQVAPDLQDRLEKFEPATEGRASGKDVFAAHRIEEQIAKGLDRKVWLPSGGSLVIDRTEAMTVVDVNTGKFTGSGGNLEETVTKNNLEAAEEIVRQLRLRDIGGIIVVDFIDMVLESNRDLVVRRLVECLGRDRTRHQVAEVTSLGLVQMTRKRIGTGLLEAFSTDCQHCQGRGVVVTAEPVEPKGEDDDDRRSGGGRRSRGRGRGDGGSPSPSGGSAATPSPADVAAMPRSEKPADTAPEVETPGAPATPDEPTTKDTPSVDVLVEEASPESPPPAQSTETPAAAADVVPAEEVPAEEVPVEESPKGAAGAAGPVAPAEPEKPRVVTRTRRRSATRPAGPPVVPASVDGAGAQPDSTAGLPASAQGELGLDHAGSADDTPHVEHVPIKKRGARKR